MIMGNESRRLLLFVIFLLAIQLRVNPVVGICEHSFIDRNKLYNFSLASPLPSFPHGVLSEDGFYQVAVNETVLWFQLCSGMIFNHDPPGCADCSDCGGPSRCGMECSALVAKSAGGYHVCTTIGQVSSTDVSILDKLNPFKGVIVRMSSSGNEHNCSLSVSILCDSTGAQGPDSIEKLGTCEYATTLRHPSACATIISIHGKGFGWFGTLLIIIICLFGSYMLAGTVYRYFFLGVHGIEAVPNLDFWVSLPHRTQMYVSTLVRQFRGPSASQGGSYSQVNF
ncbi:Leucine-rich repeat and IQ domain-containing protein 3, putative isoform 2 [Hibiscus syriacus]|uniref:Leucine-rich repeat and IQ domain-containing protein 3, putative isoform 2 n=1 Tax=Hibiscus syriacus TaxID=106335 RepID=A0A6A2ZUA1_HIBSY|nr:uncharacterized protein LOC120138678 [Hibiscus syriacus]KAE8695470.1 Leucine-rich repeat and IQ domain-containing protein 3, putative isoform 2 [Hibiscus syriacus]